MNKYGLMLCAALLGTAMFVPSHSTARPFPEWPQMFAGERILTGTVVMGAALSSATVAQANLFAKLFFDRKQLTKTNIRAFDNALCTIIGVGAFEVIWGIKNLIQNNKNSCKPQVSILEDAVIAALLGYGATRTLSPPVVSSIGMGVPALFFGARALWNSTARLYNRTQQVSSPKKPHFKPQEEADNK